MKWNFHSSSYHSYVTASSKGIILGWHCSWWYWWHWSTTMSHVYKETKKYYERERRKTLVALWLVNVTMSPTTMSPKCYPVQRLFMLSSAAIVILCSYSYIFSHKSQPFVLCSFYISLKLDRHIMPWPHYIS